MIKQFLLKATATVAMLGMIACTVEMAVKTQEEPPASETAYLTPQAEEKQTAEPESDSPVQQEPSIQSESEVQPETEEAAPSEQPESDDVAPLEQSEAETPPESNDSPEPEKETETAIEPEAASEEKDAEVSDVFWDMENLPDDPSAWAIDKYTELWGREGIGLLGGAWNVSAVDGKGWNGGRALAWTMKDWELETWGRYTWICFENDKSAVTDWSEAENLYVYVDFSEISNEGGSIPIDLTIYTEGDEGLDHTEGAAWYYAENGKWTEAKVNEWKHMLLPNGFVGWIKIPLDEMFIEPDLSCVQRICFYTEHKQNGAAAYFDQFTGTEPDGIS